LRACVWPEYDCDISGEDMAAAMKRTIETLEYLVACTCRPDVPEPCSFNFAVTNGKHLVCTRYRNDPDDEPPSLYFALGFGSLQIDSNGIVHNIPCARSSADCESQVLCVASEPLSNEQSWRVVPPNSMLVASFGTGSTIRNCYLEDLGFPEGPPPTAPLIDSLIEQINKLNDAAEQWRSALQDRKPSSGKTMPLTNTFGIGNDSDSE
jgi:hypothetical protein